MTRAQDTRDARAAADEWAAENGYPESGGYSGDWYVAGYLGGFWPDGWLKWWANYAQPAGAILGGDVVNHQFSSNPIDQDVMLETEIIDAGGDVTDEERKHMQDQINGLVSALGLLVGDDLKPLTRATAAKYVKAYVAQARALADQFGIDHV